MVLTIEIILAVLIVALLVFGKRLSWRQLNEHWLELNAEIEAHNFRLKQYDEAVIHNDKLANAINAERDRLNKNISELTKWESELTQYSNELRNQSTLANDRIRAKMELVMQQCKQFMQLCDQLIGYVDEGDLMVENGMKTSLNMLKQACKDDIDRFEQMYFQSYGRHYFPEYTMKRILPTMTKHKFKFSSN